MKKSTSLKFFNFAAVVALWLLVEHLGVFNGFTWEWLAFLGLTFSIQILSAEIRAAQIIEQTRVRVHHLSDPNE